MSLDANPLVNGKRYSFASIELRLLNKRYFGVKEINYKDKLEPGEMRGTSPLKLGRTRGKYTADGSITMGLREHDDFIHGLNIAGQNAGYDAAVGVMEVEFDGLVHFAEDGNPLVLTHQLN